MSQLDQATKVIRFGVFEVDLRTAELRKQGVRIRLPGQSFQVLEALLLRPGELVTREELKQKLWPSDTFGDFEHGLNAAVNRVRDALGDSSDNPRFVETIPRRGYRFIAPVQTEGDGPVKTSPVRNEQGIPASDLPTNVSQDSRHDPIAAPAPDVASSHPPGLIRRRGLAAAAIAIGLLAVALVVTWWRIPPAVPVVESVAQLTDDGQPKSWFVTDGSRIYLTEGTSGSHKIAQVSVTGGPVAPVQTGFPDAFVEQVARDGSGLLVTVLHGPTSGERFLWWIPLPAGEPHRLGSFTTIGADLLPDGRILFGKVTQGTDPKGTDSRTQWFIADKDGSNPRELVSFPGFAAGYWASPDGQRVLLTQELTGDRRLFEMGVDGTGRREIRKLNDGEDGFIWAPDEKYLVYQSGNARQSDIWLLPMQAGPFRRLGKPIRLTNGPLPYSEPYPSPDGKQIFVLGAKQRGELARYDMQSHEFKPFLSGISARDVTCSRDGKWVAYLSYPNNILWSSRIDGTEREQLTFPPMQVLVASISPDGSKVAFTTDKFESLVIGMEGGTPLKIDEGMYPSWSPDGNFLYYQTSAPGGGGGVIADLRTHKQIPVPSSEHMYGYWLSQDLLILRNTDTHKFQTFDLRTKKWTDFAPGILGDNVVNWTLSPDRKYLYYTTRGAEPKALRLRLADQQVETITSLKDMNRVILTAADVSVAPDGSPIFTRDTGYQEIFALNIRWP